MAKKDLTTLSQKIVQKMYNQDAFSQWLGIEVEKVAAGYCLLRMRIKAPMLNGFGIAHGGITYALADSALAFASNSKGRHAVSIETSIAHLEALQEDDVIVAEAIEDKNTHKVAWYTIRVKRQKDGALAAIFRGTVYRKSTEWNTD